MPIDLCREKFGGARRSVLGFGRAVLVSRRRVQPIVGLRHATAGSANPAGTRSRTDGYGGVGLGRSPSVHTGRCIVSIPVHSYGSRHWVSFETGDGRRAYVLTGVVLFSFQGAGQDFTRDTLTFEVPIPRSRPVRASGWCIGRRLSSRHRLPMTGHRSTRAGRWTPSDS
jgi:hypothetical protein